MGKSKTLPDYPRGITFEQVWAALMEDRERQKKRAEEFAEWKKEHGREFAEWKKEQDREAAERKKEAAERKKESDERLKELKQIVKENAKLIGNLGNRFGEMVEYLVLPNLVDKFREIGFSFTKAYPEAEIKDEKHRILAEIDITLENGDKVMIVEVKSKPTIQDIRDHVVRMKQVRRHADLHNDKRTFLGAVAGMVIKENVRDFILKNGFYTIEPSGETFVIIPPDLPKEW